MEVNEVKERLDRALRKVNNDDRILLEYDVHESCIATRLAMYLQAEFSPYSVDVEYSRNGGVLPKRLRLPVQCGRKKHGVVRPDIIVHYRGPDGPNLLVLELKKSGNTDSSECDRDRIRAFRREFRYAFGATIRCQMRVDVGISISRWFDNQNPDDI
ncbi:MAG: hypothetical protein WAM05_00855 [Candidatus Binataceae bacterium]